jgi:PAS domain S-box-containing protein
MSGSMTQSNTRLQRVQPVLWRYGLAVVSVVLALFPGLLLEHYQFHDVELPFFLFAVALTAWYAGVGPAVLAIVLSTLCFDYFFTLPLHSLALTVSDVPAVLILILFASLVTRFSAVRRQFESDLRQARDHLQTEVAERTQQASLLNLTHDSIFVRDMDFTITFWNRGAQELYGWAAEDAIGKNSKELLETVFPVPLEDITPELFTSGRWEGELKRKTADGIQVVVAARWALRRDEQGRPVAILETSNDITERKRREQEIQSLSQELAKRSTELEAINKELEAFAYSVSHDLRAPLRHVAGYTELLQRQISAVANEKASRFIATILDSAKRMGNLIDDLLSFSRVGRTETQKSQFNGEQLVKEVLNEVRRDAEGRQINWKIGAVPVLHGDRSMFRLVLVNLLSNAIKFTRTRAQAEIEVGSIDGNGEEVVVFVRDNGVGFDMKYVNKLFGVFQRLHQADAFEGTGIGLATVQRIVHRHGGRVWAEGTIDKGATFYFSTPKPQGNLWKTQTN